MNSNGRLGVDPLRTATSGLSEGVTLTLAEDSYGLPRLSVLRIERNGLGLDLVVEGLGDVGWVDVLLPRGEPGEIARPGSMNVTSMEWGVVSIRLSGARTASIHGATNEPLRFRTRLGVREVGWSKPNEQDSARWACLVLGGAVWTGYVHQSWPSGGDYSVAIRETLEHGEQCIAVNSRASTWVADHVLLDLQPHFAGEVRLGVFDKSRSAIPRPGFVTFSGDGVPTFDDDIVRGIVRGVSLLFGVGPAPVAWVSRNAQDDICSWVLKSGYSPAPDANEWPIAPFIEPERDWLVGAAALSHGLRTYLSHRQLLPLDRVAWIAAHARIGPPDRVGAALRSALETLVEASAKEDQRTVVEKSLAKALLQELAVVVDKWATENGIDPQIAQRLASKVRQINHTSGVARFPTMLEAHGLLYGTLEKEAWSFSSACAHAAPAAMNGGEEMWFRLRALQATYARTIVGVLGLHDRYIDYSTRGFPSRPVTQCVGGDGGEESTLVRFRQGRADV